MNTGIIRRLDDLGRVVIPKALRQELEWKEGTPLEMAVVNNGVFLTEYSPLGTVSVALKNFKNQVSNSNISCKSEFLQSIYELEKRLEMEQNKNA